MTQSSVSKREQLVNLQAEMKTDEDTAMRRLAVLLNSAPMKKVIKEMEELKLQCLPGSLAESQIGACVDVPNNVNGWLAGNYPAEPAEGEQTILPPMPSLSLPVGLIPNAGG